MKIISFFDIETHRWNQLCQRSDEAWLFHTYEWIEIESSNFAEANHSFAVLSDDNEIIGIQPLYFNTIGLGLWSERLLHSGVHRHTGLACLSNLSNSTIKAISKLAMKYIHELADKIEVDRIQLNSQNLAPKNLSVQREEIPFWVIDYGYNLGLHFNTNGFVPIPGMATCCADQIIEISNIDEQTLFKNLEESCQRAIKKAIKNNLSFSLNETQEDVIDYYKLAEISAQRTGENLPSLAYYQNIYHRFNLQGKCKILFANKESKRIGALWLLIDKGAIYFMAGVSDPEYLSLRVNDFMHWSVISWAKANGYFNYRLGPYFPELPKDSPIGKISRFKKKFGGKNTTIIQGSYFINPEKYLQISWQELEFLCKSNNRQNISIASASASVQGNKQSDVQKDLDIILKFYGLIDYPKHEVSVIFVSENTNLPDDVSKKNNQENTLFYRAKANKSFFKLPEPIYQSLLTHISFSGGKIKPILVDKLGYTVIGWYQSDQEKMLLIGLDVVEEIIRYRQGDPSQVEKIQSKGGFGFGHERANYLFEDQIHSQYKTQPWADNLGFLLAETLAKMTGYPLIEPLPNGAKGAVILTGDDDQAYLEKYTEQLTAIGNFPITYLLVPQTRHTSETLAKLPDNVELGLHPDALERPDEYDSLCNEQSSYIRQISGKPIRTVRNHGYLSQGYLGHLNAWENNELSLDVNYSLADGTALNGSFLPMQVRRLDGTWSNHYSLLTAFGDGMIYALKMTQQQAIKKIRQLTKQIENNHPGVLVFNFHPQNISDTYQLHQEVLKINRRPGWISLGLESYLNWLEIKDKIELKKVNNQWTLTCPETVRGLVIRFPTDKGWKYQAIPEFTGEFTLSIN
jgi:hypothetical protein